MLQVRLLAVSVAVLAAARFSPAYLSSKALGFVHLIAFGTFLGTNIWTTFVAGLTMFKNLPRQVWSAALPLLRLDTCSFDLPMLACFMHASRTLDTMRAVTLAFKVC